MVDEINEFVIKSRELGQMLSLIYHALLTVVYFLTND